jgi:hypothetical protein
MTNREGAATPPQADPDEREALIASTEALIVTFSRYCRMQFGYRPTEDEFRMMLRQATILAQSLAASPSQSAGPGEPGCAYACGVLRSLHLDDELGHPFIPASSDEPGAVDVERLVDILDDAEGDGIIGPDYTPPRLAEYILARLQEQRQP